MFTLKQLCLKFCAENNFKRYNLEFLPVTIKRDLKLLDSCCFIDYENLDEDDVSQDRYYRSVQHVYDLLKSNHIECFKRLVDANRYNTRLFTAIMSSILDSKKWHFLKVLSSAYLHRHPLIRYCEIAIRTKDLEFIKIIISKCSTEDISRQILYAMQRDDKVIFEYLCNHLIDIHEPLENFWFSDILNRKVFYIKYLIDKGLIDATIIDHQLCSDKKRQRILRCNVDKPKKEKRIKSELLSAFLENRLEDFKVQLQSKPVLPDILLKKILRKANTSYLQAALENSVISAEDAMAKLVGKNPNKIKLIKSFM